MRLNRRPLDNGWLFHLIGGESMFQMEVKICRLDDRPADKSIAYKLLHLCLGDSLADRLTYKVVVPKDDDRPT